MPSVAGTGSGYVYHECGYKLHSSLKFCPDCGKPNDKHLPKTVRTTKNFSARAKRVELFKEKRKEIAKLNEELTTPYKVIRQFAQLRVMKGLSQKEASLMLGKGETYIGMVEKGSSSPSLRQLQEMALLVGAQIEMTGWGQ